MKYMKKLLVCLSGLLSLSGCTLLSSKENDTFDEQGYYKVEDHATLNIQMDDAAYAKALTDLWNTRFPQHKKALHIETAPYKKRTLQYDIQWVRDKDIQSYKKELLDITDLNDHMELHVEPSLQYDENHFMPIEGKGLVFLYNVEKLKERGGDEGDIQSFEKLLKLGDYVYYHNRYAAHVDPFLFYDTKGDKDFWQDDLQTRLSRYRRLNKKAALYDDAYEKHNFYDNHYVCGLIMNDGSYLSHISYQKGDLHFAQMPTYEGEQFSPTLDTYGFVVDKHVRYPGAAMAFLQLVRSEQGMQALIKYTDKSALIRSDELKDFDVFDHSRKELMEAINHSQLENDDITRIVHNTDFYALVENALYGKASDEAVTARILNALDMKKGSD